MKGNVKSIVKREWYDGDEQTFIGDIMHDAINEALGYIASCNKWGIEISCADVA